MHEHSSLTRSESKCPRHFHSAHGLLELSQRRALKCLRANRGTSRTGLGSLKRSTCAQIDGKRGVNCTNRYAERDEREMSVNVRAAGLWALGAEVERVWRVQDDDEALREDSRGCTKAGVSMRSCGRTPDLAKWSRGDFRSSYSVQLTRAFRRNTRGNTYSSQDPNPLAAVAAR